LNYVTVGTTLLNNYNTKTTTASILTNYPTIGTTLLNNYNTQTTTASILSNYPTLGTTLLTNYNTQTTTASILLNYAPLNNPTFTGNISAPSISIGGVDTSSLYQARFQIGGYVNANGTLGGNYGSKTFTINKTGTGAYTITFSANIGSVVYAVVGGIRNGTGSISYNGTAATGVNIQTYNLAGTQTDLAFNFYILQ
jgi:uncharacterized protein (DUF433 family)